MSFCEAEVTWDRYKEIAATVLAQQERVVLLHQGTFIAPPLFRGQADSRWALEDTLSRVRKNETETAYLGALRHLAKMVSSYTVKDWTEAVKEIQKWFAERQSLGEGEDIALSSPPGYAFMVYLRHLGYPSPLLDWTTSPYIAAYFAFADLDRCQDVSCKSSVFIFEDSKDGGKSWAGSEPVIALLGPSLTTHQRHYAQQCWYTVCRKEDGEKIVYASHQEAAQSQALSTQDIVKKLNFSNEEKRKALKELDLMGINFYTLFGTEEYLVKAHALQKYVLGERL